MTESTADTFLRANGIDPMAMHPSGVPNWEAFDKYCEEQARAAGMQLDKTNEANLRRIINAGYPTLYTYDGDGGTRIFDWWSDDTGDRLAEAFSSAADDGNDEGMDAAQKAIAEHERALFDETFSVLRAQGKVSDLLHLIDAAAERGSAFYADSSAGRFLARIAELAMAQIKAEAEIAA